MISSYFWQFRANSSGFQYQRIAHLTYQMPDGDLIDGFQSFPASGILMGILSTILNLPPADINYLPLIFIGGVPSVLLLICAFNRTDLAILLGFGIIIFVFSRRFHYSQYAMAMALYPAFVWVLYRYITNGRREFGIIAGALIIIVYLLGPQIASWGVGLLIVTVFSLFIAEHGSANIVQSNFHIPAGLAGAVLLVFLWFDRKLWDQLPERLLAITFFDSGSSLSSEYAASRTAPEILQWINIAWLSMATLPVILGALWLTYKRGFNPFSRLKEELYLLAVLAGAGIEFLVYLLIRGLTLRSVMLLSPFLAGYYVYRLVPRRVAISFAVVFLTLSLMFAAITLSGDMGRQANTIEESEHAANFAYASGDQVTTDHYTFGELRLGVANQGVNPRSVGFSAYDEDVYRFLIEGGEPPGHVERFLVINKGTIEQPLYPGEDWFEFKPIGENYETIHGNQNISKVYSSYSYDVHKTY